MFLFEEVRRLGVTWSRARRAGRALREMNGLPPALQRDIGWPGSVQSRAAASTRPEYWHLL